MNKTTRICLSAMVKNESHVILRMLESCYKYVDYWIVQDNGSTDGTQDLIKNFFKEKGIPGYLYDVEWQYPGWNRDHVLQECLKSNSNYDWILRMDADEILEVDDDFDWSVLNDTTIQSFNITSVSPGAIYHRTWLWNAKLKWQFKHDKRHEVIELMDPPGTGENFQRIDLDKKFRHVLTNDGMTWFQPMKFLKDALELEADQVCSSKIVDDDYHLFYIAKSYNDCYNDAENLPFGKDHADEYARRCIFYFEKYIQRKHPDFFTTGKIGYLDEMSYLSLCLISQAKKFLGKLDECEIDLIQAYDFCPDRNEHLVFLAELYDSLGDYEKMYQQTSFIVDNRRNNPFPRWRFIIYTTCYPDTGNYVQELHERAKQLTGRTAKKIEVIKFPGQI
jgi:glycosyltransferase involved in cell wall biosynthesis